MDDARDLGGSASGVAPTEPFEALFDAHPQAMWILDCETTELLAVNGAAAEQYGYSRDELQALTLRDLRAEGDAGSSNEALEALRADLPGRTPAIRSMRHRHKDGGIAEVEIRSYATPPFHGRRARLCLVREVTDPRRSERTDARYQALLENSRDKVLFIAPDGRILECNPVAERTYGYSRDELLRMRISDLRDPSTVQDVGRQLARATEEGLRFETTHRRRDGSTFPVEVSSRAVMLGQDRVLVSVIRDISDERKARLVLQSVEQRLRLMLEDAPLAVLVLDRNGIVEYANPFFLALTGRTWQEVVGRRAFGAFLATGPATPPRAHFQCDLITRTGVRQMSWTQSNLRDEMGGAEGFLYIGSDMTEHWHSERALRRSEQRFRALIEHNPDGVALLSAGKLTYVNPALALLLGRERDELLAQPLEELVHEGDRAALQAQLSLAERGGERTGPLLDLRFLQAGGRIAYAEVASLAVEADAPEGDAAQAGTVLLVARDVTERLQMQGRLVQASRLASVGTLAAGVAHEINNPLAYVEANSGYVASIWPRVARELLARREGKVPPEEVEPPLDAAVLQEVSAALSESALGIERVRTIVAGLKHFARSEAEALRRLDLKALVESCLQTVAHEFRHRARVVKELGAVPEVMGNDSRLSQVFLNLLLNAAQALPPEGAGALGEVRVRTFTDAQGRAVVSVEDTGCGIAKDVLPRIFDPFFTTRTVGEGTGLGLSIAHGIVSSQGGSIEVESTQGEGTTVRVLLPSAEQSAARDAQEAHEGDA